MADHTRTRTSSVSRSSAETPRPTARLLVVSPPGSEAILPVGAGTTVMGRVRSDDVDAVIGHPTVSRRHLELARDGVTGTYTAVDRGSHNGSWLDGVPLSDARRIVPDSAVLRVGDVVCVFECGPEVGGHDPGEVDREAVPGQSTAAVTLRRSLAEAADDPAPVLILGETGVGKEFVAREIHRLSGRSGPLIAVNCAELTESLIESQLFGHERGSFTGATSASEGLFRAARDGTLFLDEIGELPLAMQPKLLRAVQEGEVRPLGGTRSHAVNVRIVAGTNLDLHAAVEAGTFRQDLLARLAMWELRIPPLRRRRPDVLEWMTRLRRAWDARRKRASPPPELAPDAVEALLVAPWPDNLRGLDRVVHRLRSMPQPVSKTAIEGLLGVTSGTVPADEQQTPRQPVPTREELAAAMERFDGSIRSVAKHFERDRRQIYRWLDKYGLRE